MKDRVTLADKEGLITLAAVASTLQDVGIAGIESRLAGVPGGSKNLAELRHLAQKLLDDLFRALPIRPDDARWWRQTASIARLYIGIQGTYGHPLMDGLADFGLYLPYKDINVILRALSDHCMLCSKTKQEAHDCELGRVLQKIPATEADDDNFCVAQRSFTEAVFDDDAD